MSSRIQSQKQTSPSVYGCNENPVSAHQPALPNGDNDRLFIAFFLRARGQNDARMIGFSFENKNTTAYDEHDHLRSQVRDSKW
ncbi:hypothetical protein PABG_00767 [Paracoccidioides brasiliensis Pb03]|nr:hypothetical protein PABG_00767 [Paracoccidioides brasiliensis Pb03]